MICLGNIIPVSIYVCWAATVDVYGSSDARRLYHNLMEKYNANNNKLIRPVLDNTGILNVSMGLKFTQLIGVDEVNQVISTSVVVKQAWNDYKLVWNPEDYGGIERIFIPSEAVWLPDMILYNNADGNYQITSTSTKVTVEYTGDMLWDPPAIYKSYCRIDVSYFPYDKQSCDMKFGSWTYDGLSVNLLPTRGYEKDNKKIDVGMDLSEFKTSVEWDILEASAKRHTVFYPCCREPYLDITFTIVIRRKALFYTVNLITPCVAISLLTVFVFYLPSDSGEKVTLCISILLSLTVFFLLLSKIIPPTSLEMPLIGKYLLFTMVMVTLSIVTTIIVLNLHFRNPSTHKMRPWVRKFFLHFLPKVLMIQRPADKRPRKWPLVNGPVSEEHRQEVAPLHEKGGQRPDVLLSHGFDRYVLGKDIQNVVDGINYISEQVKETTVTNHTILDWKYLALVLDRLFLWIFSVTCTVGTASIILDAPPLYEDDEPIPRNCTDPIKLRSNDPWHCLFQLPDQD